MCVVVHFMLLFVFCRFLLFVILFVFALWGGGRGLLRLFLLLLLVSFRFVDRVVKLWDVVVTTIACVCVARCVLCVVCCHRHCCFICLPLAHLLLLLLIIT